MKRNAVRIFLTLLLLAGFVLAAACGGTAPKTTDEPTLTPEEMVDSFIEANYGAVISLNEQFGEIYDCDMYREGTKLIYEFRLKVDTAGGEFAKSIEAGGNAGFLNIRDTLSEYTGNEDAVVVVRAVDAAGNVLYESEITKDTPLNEVEGVEVTYGSLSALVSSAAIQAQIHAQDTYDVAIEAEAEDETTLLIRYVLQQTYDTDALPEIRAQQEALLQSAEVVDGMKTTYLAVTSLLPGQEIKLRVTVEDLNGVELAQRLFTAKEFEIND